jgi:hypothetical protein
MMESIHADRRHYNMRLFIEERTTTRMFEDFSMGFVIRLDMLQSLERLRSGRMEPQACGAERAVRRGVGLRLVGGVGPSDRNRTCICRLGGGRSIH